MSVSLKNGNQYNEELTIQIIISYLSHQMTDTESKYDIKNLIPDDLYNNINTDTNNYIFKNANSSGLQHEVSVIVEAMLHMVAEFEKRYQSELHAHLKSVTSDFNSNEVASSYQDIILTLFDEKINAGRLVALFAFLNATVVYLCEIEHVDIIKNIIHVTLNLFDTRLNKWIDENDGWVI